MNNLPNQNPIRVNHVGFTSDAPKQFVLTDNKSGSDTFKVYWLYECDKEPKEMFSGKMTLKDKENDLWYGDFSSVTTSGDYFICAGGHTSRFFLIYDKAYDNLSRILLSYFTYQRCGSDLGWAGKCHLDDGFIKETGEKVDLSGGYHQSGDLRKSPGGVSIGVLGMLRYAIKDTSAWGRILFCDEVKWACDYFVKTIQENGAMYNTLNEPFGWSGRTFYKSAAPSSAQWCTTSILTLGSMYFKDKDPALAEKYLKVAIRSWDYMTGSERSYELYDHPAPTPRGMDQPSFYSMCKRDNTADMAYMAVMAYDLYLATGDIKYAEYVTKGADKLLSLMGKGDTAMCILLDDNQDRLAFMTNSYSHANGGFMALCAAFELTGDEKYKKAIADVAGAMCKLAKENPWQTARMVYSDTDLDMIVGHPAPGRYLPSRRETMQELVCIGSVENNGKEFKCYYNKPLAKRQIIPSAHITFGVFLKRASKLLGDNEIYAVAQSQLDAILGANHYDASHINGVGQNQIAHKPFGQFFPPVPHIPGAINIGIESINHDEYSEYDMPCVGMFMFLLSEYLQ